MGNFAYNFVNIAGQRFGRLLVINYAGRNARNYATWNCLCDCGNKMVAVGSELRRKGSRRTQSCGCIRREAAFKLGRSQKTHGLTKSREYASWICMKQRCYYLKDKSYFRYGGRGITVCDRWLESFENFYADMGSQPSSTHTLERIDNEGNYEPNNCKWGTPEEQGNNKRSVPLLTFRGKTQSLTQWARELHIKPVTLQTRLGRLQWPLEKALTAPLDLSRRAKP